MLKVSRDDIRLVLSKKDMSARASSNFGKRSMQLFLLILVNVIVLVAGDVAADVYKCPDGQGRIVLKDEPCTITKDTPIPTAKPSS